VPSLTYAVIAVALLGAACNRSHAAADDPYQAHLIPTSGAPLMAPPTAANAKLPPATYTTVQAARGKTVYESTCAHCHPPGQQSGASFAMAWDQRPVFDLYSIVRNTMPQDKPGSLSDRQYIDVVAYMLQMNAMPASTVALRTDSAALKQVKISVGSAR
jgi:mono/diheme cytochrome c family protein